MADDERPAATEEAPPPAKPTRRRSGKAAAPPAAPAPKAKKEAETPAAPKRATVDAATARLLAARRAIDKRRPIFGRQAANRYWRIGRDGAWRRPRGQQSKQRRHYGYRAEIVSIGYRSPAAVRGLAPSGFRPVIVHSAGELEGLDGRRQAAVIGRTVGTRRRLVLEQEARRLGIRVLNPIVKAEEET
ncbi:MAG TPA: 50S ribosomal protein L32e [Thermoplasmata archaeon]|nr:50S ribosomal protein L32e [Thermoplasmata archaeon]